MHVVERAPHLALHALQTAAHLLQVVLESEHALDAGQVQAEVGRESLDQA
jgi:hypothetical protein